MYKLFLVIISLIIFSSCSRKQFEQVNLDLTNHFTIQSGPYLSFSREIITIYPGSAANVKLIGVVKVAISSITFKNVPFGVDIRAILPPRYGKFPAEINIQINPAVKAKKYEIETLITDINSKQQKLILTLDVFGIGWTKQFGTNKSDYLHGIATDSADNVYLVDSTYVGPGAAKDIFLRKYDADGNEILVKQIAKKSNDEINNIAVAMDGGLYVVGHTKGNAPLDGYDAFIRKYGSSGEPVWSDRFGTDSIDYAYTVNTDIDGNVYVGGDTGGSLFGPNFGDGDVFIRKYQSNGYLLSQNKDGESPRLQARRRYKLS